MMVIDSSALIAILLGEPEADTFMAAIAAAPRRLIGTPSLLETAMVMVGRLGPAGRGMAGRLAQSIAAEIAPFTPGQAERAIEAFLRYGKGRHPAELNFGDCCSYALAVETGLPMLFKSNDFARTGIRSALAPPAHSLVHHLCFAAIACDFDLALPEVEALGGAVRRSHSARPVHVQS